MPQNGMYAPPGLLPDIKGGAYIAFFAMCAMRGSKHAGILKPEIAHMPQNGMYVPPRKLDHGPCAMRSSKHAALLKPETAHMPQNGMYGVPG